jgi:hypothetical protein
LAGVITKAWLAVLDALEALRDELLARLEDTLEALLALDARLLAAEDAAAADEARDEEDAARDEAALDETLLEELLEELLPG